MLRAVAGNAPNEEEGRGGDERGGTAATEKSKAATTILDLGDTRDGGGRSNARKRFWQMTLAIEEAPVCACKRARTKSTHVRKKRGEGERGRGGGPFGFSLRFLRSLSSDLQKRAGPSSCACPRTQRRNNE